MIIGPFREANIHHLVASLELMAPLFFSLDNVHNSRWVSVFIQDLKHLPVKLPSLYDEFKKGNFVVNTCGNSFSNFTIGQAQKHCNKKIKSVSGYINMVNQEDKELFQKIEFCWEENHQYLESFEGSPVA